MCILSYLPTGTDVDVDGLLNGGINNPDGHGWAIALPAEGRILSGKSLDVQEALDQFADVRAKNLAGPALFHSRWATHGSISVDNVHPFNVGGNPLTVVAHNGILPKEAYPGKGDDRSDTRLFADDILSTRYRRLDKPTAFYALSQWATRSNKLVILTVDPRYQRNAYLVNEDMGQWDAHTGIWHSNGDYKYAWAKYDNSTSYGSYTGVLGYSTVPKATPKAVERGICYVCEIGDIDEHGYCVTCGTCDDCLEFAPDCQCAQIGSSWYDKQVSRWQAEEEAYEREQAQHGDPTDTRLPVLSVVRSYFNRGRTQA